jgi:hypothetical protein
MLYPYNYLLVSANDDLDIEIEAGGTRFEAGAASKAAFVTLLDGDTWMLYRNVLTSALHWDFVRFEYLIHTSKADSRFRVSWVVSSVSLLLMHSGTKVLACLVFTDDCVLEPLGLLNSM